MPNEYRETLVIYMDLETTGLSIDTDDIIELAAQVDPCCLRSYNIDEESAPDDAFETLVKPHSKSISEGASSVHGLRAEHVANAPGLRKVLLQFVTWLNVWLKTMNSVIGRADACRIILVGHNNFHFDQPILMRQMQDVGVDMPRSVYYADTLQLCEYFFCMPGRSFKLESLWKDWIVKHMTPSEKEKAQAQDHRAAADVRMLIAVAVRCYDWESGFLDRMISTCTRLLAKRKTR